MQLGVGVGMGVGMGGVSSVAMRLPLIYRFAVRHWLIAFQAAVAVVVGGGGGRWRCRRTQLARLEICSGSCIVILLIGLHIDGRIILLQLLLLLLPIGIHIHGAMLQQRWRHMHRE